MSSGASTGGEGCEDREVESRTIPKYETQNPSKKMLADRPWWAAKFGWWTLLEKLVVDCGNITANIVEL